ncbi:TRAP transporter substrate-binding protein [Pseudoxanthobacter sp.]|uniref:TRAP transporter substrate-binding protein n=1 Tax=Pseudoxanthobacter sp. TaxID=1925742 RepID=UPI002FE1A440
MRLDRRQFIAGAAAVSAFAITGRANAATTLKVAHASPEESLIQKALLRFKAEVEKETGGSVRISLFANGLLGDEGPISEAVGDGSIDMGLGGVVDAIDPRLNVVSLPFLFDSFTQVHAVLDGPVGAELKAMAPPRGYEILGFLDSGFRSFTNNRHPIAAPADMAGLKMRCPPIPVIIETVKVLGALPQAIPYGEVYTSLQSGVVDGAEPELRDFYDAKWFEVQKFLSLSNYIWTANYWYANKAKLDGLSPADRAAVTRAAASTQAWYRGEIGNVYASLIATLGEKGLKINQVDTAPFKAMVGPVYETFSKEYGAALVSSVRAAAQKA